METTMKSTTFPNAGTFQINPAQDTIWDQLLVELRKSKGQLQGLNNLLEKVQECVNTMKNIEIKVSPYATASINVAQLIKQTRNKIDVWWNTYKTATIKTLDDIVSEVQNLGTASGNQRRQQRQNKLDKFPNVGLELQDVQSKIDAIRTEIATIVVTPENIVATERHSQNAINQLKALLSNFDSLFITSNKLLKSEKELSDSIPSMIKQFVIEVEDLIKNSSDFKNGKNPFRGTAVLPHPVNSPTKESQSHEEKEPHYSKPAINNPQSLISTPILSAKKEDDSPSKLSGDNGSDSDSNNDSPSNHGSYSQPAKINSKSIFSHNQANQNLSKSPNQYNEKSDLYSQFSRISFN
jgi:DNA replication initiation complex subunit (GINS family)